jgi:hypothetical protein
VIYRFGRDAQQTAPLTAKRTVRLSEEEVQQTGRAAHDCLFDIVRTPREFVSPKNAPVSRRGFLLEEQ